MSINKIIVNCETGESQEVPLTAEELAQLEVDQAAAASVLAAEQAEAARIAALKETAKAKLVAGEPLSAEEAALLIG